MKLAKFLSVLCILFPVIPSAFASLAEDAGLSGHCESFLDQMASKVGIKIPPVLSHINIVILRNYTPRSLHQVASIEEIAYGDMPPEIMEKLPNFVGDSDFKSTSELEELRARSVADMITDFLPDWRKQRVWFFQTGEDLKLFKEGASLPSKFETGSFVIMRGGYAIGRASLNELESIQWL